MQGFLRSFRQKKTVFFKNTGTLLEHLEMKRNTGLSLNILKQS